jgi:serine/threonine protein kinase
MLIVHRDLKPENLMFGSDLPESSRYLTIIICDLGTCMAYEEEDACMS